MQNNNRRVLCSLTELFEKGAEKEKRRKGQAGVIKGAPSPTQRAAN